MTPGNRLDIDGPALVTRRYILLPFTMAGRHSHPGCSRAGADLGPQEQLYAFEDLCVLWLSSTVLSDHSSGLQEELSSRQSLGERCWPGCVAQGKGPSWAHLSSSRHLLGLIG